MSYTIVEEYRTLGKPELGLAKKGDEYFWFRFISEEFISSPEFEYSDSVPKEIIMEKETESDDDVSVSDSSLSEYSVSEEEDDSMNQKVIYKYALFKLSKFQLDKCLAAFKNKKDVLEQRRKSDEYVLEVRYDFDLDQMFEGEFNLIDQNDFSNFYQPKTIESIDPVSLIDYTEWYNVAKPDPNNDIID